MEVGEEGRGGIRRREKDWNQNGKSKGKGEEGNVLVICLSQVFLSGGYIE